MKGYFKYAWMLLLLIAGSCKKQEDPLEGFVLQGEITEYGTGAKIDNAKIRIQAYHFTGVVDSKEDVGVTYSNSEGFYTIRPKVPTISFDTIYRNTIDIHVTKEGFKECEVDISYAMLKRSNTTYTYSIQLSK